MLQASRLNQTPAVPLMIAGGAALCLILLLVSTPRISYESDETRILTHAQNYMAAARTFKAQHLYWPGDYPMAEAKGWGANGDGNGRIEGMERQAAWEHLAKAGLLTWKGSDFSDTTHTRYGINVPPAEAQGLGFAFSYFISDSASGNALVLGNSSSAYHLSPALVRDSDLYRSLRSQLSDASKTPDKGVCGGVQHDMQVPDDEVKTGFVYLWLERAVDACP